MTPEQCSEQRNRMKALNCCVIIPTYNNEQTIGIVISEVQQLCQDIYVVNDGSTDDTSEILSKFPSVNILAYSPNRGKGMALRTGLAAATSAGFRYAVTIDSDGQHFPDDLPGFLDEIEKEPDSLLVGARNLNQENMPRKNTFGNKFSNFWFAFFTGIHLPDTQSGYRLYPLQKLAGLRFHSSRYEFEVEVIVRAAWRGIRVHSVPVKVFYAEGEKRITHFRPGRDFTRISILNTLLFFPAVLWYKPIRLIRNFTRKNIRSFLNKHFLDPSESSLRKSTCVGFGVFMGIIPIWGYQFVTALLLAHLFKMNKVIVGVAANISVPPMIPFLLYGSLKTGQAVLGKDFSDNIFNQPITIESMKQHLQEYLVGSFVFAMIMALLLGLLVYIILKTRENRISG